GHNSEKTAEFAEEFQAKKVDSWQDLINHPEIDLIFVCTINRDHGAIAEAALEANKHVVVEYPLSLNPKQAQDLVALAESKGKLLHIEHIELLGGIHQTIREYLPKLGNIFF
ncbi:MAG: glycosyl transferase family 2, partial [Phototrophicales bacterium]